MEARLIAKEDFWRQYTISIYFVTIAALKRHKTAKVYKSMHIECYLHDEVPEEKLATDVVPETDVVPGAGQET